MSAGIGTPRLSARPRRPERPAGLLSLGVIVLVLSLIPYLCGYLLAQPETSFLGALNNIGDLSQYLAAIRQGSTGAWHYTNQFSPDNARHLFIYTPYLLVGHVSLGLSPAAAFNVMRLFCAAAALYALASFCRLFIGPFALRACWLFVVLAGGLYWLALPLSAFVPGLIDPASLTAPELSPLITMLVSPHESLGLAAELMGFFFILRAAGADGPLWAENRPRAVDRAGKARLVAGAAASFFVLALSYPFLLPTVGLVLFVYAAIAARSAWNARIAAAMPKRRLRASEVFLAELRTIVIALIPAGIVGVYYLNVFRWDPLWSHSGMAQVGRPDFGVLLFAFGALAIGAYSGARRLLALRLSGGDATAAAWAWFPLIWAIVNFCTLTLPIWQQGRQALGLTVPLALLSFLSLAGPRVVTDGMRGAL
ncbi:MAG: putative rane protein, partial [Chloroflexi bacterium]|nr:putative rane protein [Chloroflexota bacterium]